MEVNVKAQCSKALDGEAEELGRSSGELSYGDTHNTEGSGDGEDQGGDTGQFEYTFFESSCGYCRSPGWTSLRRERWTESITVDHYQDLIDQGWSRSGFYIYKMEMEETCCPTYTIRLKARDFTPSKDQIRVLKKMERFLDGSLDMEKPMELGDAKISIDHSNQGCDNLCSTNAVENSNENFIKYLSERVDQAVLKNVECGMLPGNVKFRKASVKMVTHLKHKLPVQVSKDLLYSSNIAFQIAAALKASQPGKDELKEICSKDIAKVLAESLKFLYSDNGLAARACNGHLNFYTIRLQSYPGKNISVDHTCHRGLKKCIRKGRSVNSSSEILKGKKRKMEILLKKSSFDPEEYALYKKYQIKVHKNTPDQVSEESYKNFLVDSPLVYVSASGDSNVPSCGYGSFHQQYVIDGHLVAVGVMDIFPRGLSSIYFFWDPDYAFLSLGKYSALQEINWVKNVQDTCWNFEYYYLGHYIHSCSKTSYKATFRPSELLCPLRYQWINFDIAKPLLDKKSYVVLSDAIRSESEPIAVDSH